jgi:Trm5-related predicted tRNA methylase
VTDEIVKKVDQILIRGILMGLLQDHNLIELNLQVSKVLLDIREVVWDWNIWRVNMLA